MHRFWDNFLRPVILAAAPRVICEVGSRGGDLTRRLLWLAGDTGAVVHVIDPAPDYDVRSWKKEFGDSFVFHRALSLDALPVIPLPDVVMIDGDHNWYTVFHELELLERRAVESGRVSPVIALHDVDWPYGRRDLYYDPATIPAPERQPHARKGIYPGRSDLARGGINSHLYNALHEGGARNGVLTAVEDFVGQAERQWSFATVPGLHGLGLLLGSDTVALNPALAQAAARWHDPDVLRAHIKAVDAARVKIDLRRIRAEQAVERSRLARWSERLRSGGRRARGAIDGVRGRLTRQGQPVRLTTERRSAGEGSPGEGRR